MVINIWLQYATRFRLKWIQLISAKIHKGFIYVEIVSHSNVREENTLLREIEDTDMCIYPIN